MAQDDYYYEIQLTNKQLVFYFMAGATGLILSFLAGVMVGRGVDSTAADVQAARPIREEKIVAEEPVKTTPVAAASPGELSYAQRLESDKPDDSLEKPTASKPKEPAAKPKEEAEKPKDTAAADASAKPAKPGKDAKGKKGGKTPPEPAAAGSSAPVVADAAPAPGIAPPPAKPADTSAKPTDSAKPAPARTVSGTFTIQVGAFKDKTAAESVVSRLKGKGYSAYVASPDGAEGGLYNVRVGSYTARADAERTESKLKDEEKFKPFIVRN